MKWIKVSDSLPVEHIDVLVCTKWGSVEVGYCYLTNDRKIAWAGDLGLHSYPDDFIVYWMTIPDPPEELK